MRHALFMTYFVGWRGLMRLQRTVSSRCLLQSEIVATLTRLHGLNSLISHVGLDGLTNTLFPLFKMTALEPGSDVLLVNAF